MVKLSVRIWYRRNVMKMCNKQALCALLLLMQTVGCVPLFATNNSAIAQRRVSPRRPTPAGVQNQMTNGLQFRLSEGIESSARQQNVPQVVADRLSNDDTQNVLKRLQPIKADANDEQEFAMRDRSLPPPRTGKTVDASFP